MTGRLGEGTIRIDGDATKFNKVVDGVKNGLRGITEGGKEVGAAFAMVANQSLELFERVIGYAKGLKDHVTNQMKLAAEVERGDVAWKMLRRQNQELFDAAQNSFEYSYGLLKVRDSIFSINDVLGKGINLNKQLYEELIQVSSIASMRLNKPLQTMMEQFVAMGTKMEANSEEMKMLGIQINRDKVFQNYALSINKAVESLTEAEKRTAFLSEVLDQIKGKSLVSAEEVDVLTSITQAYERYTDVTIDYSEKYAGSIAQIGVAIDNLFQDTTKSLNVQEAEKKRILNESQGVYKTWGDFVRANTSYVQEGQEMLIIKTAELQAAEERLAGAVDRLKKELKDTEVLKRFRLGVNDLGAEFKQGIITIDDYGARIDALGAALGVNFDDVYLTKIRQINDAVMQEREEMYTSMDKLNAAFSKSSGVISDFSKVTKKTFKDVKEEVKKIEPPFKDDDLIAYLDMLYQYDQELTGMASKIREANNELFTGIYRETMDTARAGYVENAQTLDSLTLAYQNELERFKQYARDKKLTAEELAMGLEAIQKRANDKAYSLDQKHYDMEGDLKKEAAAFALNTANALYSAMLSDQENAVQAAFANAMLQAGAGVYAAGVENVWVGFGKLFSILTAAEGAKQMGGGALQIAGAAAIGFVGKAALPTGGGEKTARVENQIEQKNRDIDQKTEVYLFKSEREWVQKVKDASKKF